MARAADQIRERYRLRAKLSIYRRRVDRALGIIHDALAIGPAYVAFSGGKDSSALLHLVRSIAPETPAFFYDSGAETPGTWEIIHQTPNVQVIRPLRDIVELARAGGMFGAEGGDEPIFPEEIRYYLIEEPAARVRAMGYRVTFLGLRQEESRAREISLKRRGAIYQRQDGAIIACPLRDWEGADVFAYLFAHDIPISRVYLDPAQTDRERERERTGTMLGTINADRGRIQRLRRVYPEVWTWLRQTFPELGRMG